MSPSLGLQSPKNCSSVVPSGKANLCQRRSLLWLLCGYLSQHGHSHKMQRKPALMPKAPPAFFSHAGAHTAVFSWFFPLLLTLPCNILPSLKYAFTELPPAWLMGSVVSYSGPDVEPAGTSCVWHRAVPDLFSQRPPLMLTPGHLHPVCPLAFGM